jgi:formimidoylglutamate deiminase
MLEVSQRLQHRGRAILTNDVTRSNGRFLLERAAQGGAQAIGRNSGRIETGRLADLVALRDDTPFLDWPNPDQRLDSWIFGVEGKAVSEVWSAGRHIVRGAQHINRDVINSKFAKVMRRLGQDL